MINKLEKYICRVYAVRVLTAIFFTFNPAIFAAQLNDSREGFFKILSMEIPETRDIIYISENYGDISSVKEKPTVVVMAIKADGSGGIPIIEGESILSIQVSPDKNELLLIAPDHSSNRNDDTVWLNSHIWLYSEGKLKQLTRGMVMDSDAIWSPSGDKIYFTRSKIFIDIISGALRATEGNVWVMNPDGSEPRQLTYSRMHDVVNITPIPTKDNKKILFATNRNAKWQMYIMDTDGSNQEFFIDNGMMGNWSPDGKFLAFMNASPGDIYLATRSGELIERLTKEGDVNFSPSWSPDGQYLIYSRINMGNINDNHSFEEPAGENSPGSIPKIFFPKESFSNIWKLPVNKKRAAKRLTHEGLNNSFPHWIKYP